MMPPISQDAAKLSAKTQFAHAVRALIEAFGHDGALQQLAAMANAVMLEHKNKK